MKKHNLRKICISAILLIFAAILIGETLPEPPPNFHETDAGTEANPYQIETLANLRWLSETISVWGCNYHDSGWIIGVPRFFIQTADIDAEETMHWNNGLGFSPIGVEFMDDHYQYTHPFKGTYNGNNKVISNLFIGSGISDYHPFVGPYWGLGLFGYVYNAHIYSLRLENVTIFITEFFSHIYGGALVAYSMDSLIQNCVVSIQSMRSDGSLIRSNLVGSMTNTIVEYCSAEVEVGGLSSELRNNSIIRDSYAMGSVHGVSGLIYEMFNSEVYNVYNASIDGFLSNNMLGNRLTGSSSFSHSFWDIESTPSLEPFDVITPLSTISHIYGLTTAEMKTAEPYIQNGWDFVNIWDINPDVNDGFPYLRHNTIHQILSINDDTIPMPTSQLLSNYPNPFNPSTTITFSISPSQNSPHIYGGGQGGDKIGFAELAGSVLRSANSAQNDSGGEHVAIDIYNIRGQKVRSLVNDMYGVGTHKVTWNGTDDAGRNVSSGVYFYRMTTDGYTATKRMVLMK